KLILFPKPDPAYVLECATTIEDFYVSDHETGSMIKGLACRPPLKPTGEPCVMKDRTKLPKKSYPSQSVVTKYHGPEDPSAVLRRSVTCDNPDFAGSYGQPQRV